MSLAVNDLEKSLAFYRTMGFEPIDGNAEQGWLLLRDANERSIIGLFQGFFEENLITFNPPDVRAIQAHMQARGVDFIQEADESTTGPASAVVADPDGNLILIDQF